MKHNDTSPAIQIDAKDAAGVAKNITGATIKFHMRAKGASVAKVDAAGSIVAGASGVMKYQWITGDTDTTGTFEGEFEVTYTDSTIETFPNGSRYIRIKIAEEIA